MINLLELQCRTQDENITLVLLDEAILLIGQQNTLNIKINLDTKIKWEITKNGIRSMEIQQKKIFSESKELEQLKEFLDGRIVYLGIQNNYETIILLAEKINTKVCLLENKITNISYCCKCIKKQPLNINQTHTSINIFYKLQQYSQFPKLIEVYESENKIYILMEKLKKQLPLDLDHEEIQILALELLNVIKILVQNEIEYQSFCISKIMLDSFGNLKLLHTTRVIKQKHIDFEFYLPLLGKILLLLYGGKESYNDLPNIPDGGNEFILGLLNPNLDYRLGFYEAMNHKYITNQLCETNIKIKSPLKTKFKGMMDTI